MEENLEDIGDRRLTELMIAGTHNSASYDRFSHKDNNLYTKYSLCQDENVFNQLVFGIRYCVIVNFRAWEEGIRYLNKVLKLIFFSSGLGSRKSI